MTWNGYGLSIWGCKCGARRKVTGYLIRHDAIAFVQAEPCKRCGSEMEPTKCYGDPWHGMGDESAA